MRLPRFPTADFRAIYEAYPRHLKPRVALRAIENAWKRLCDPKQEQLQAMHTERMQSENGWAYDFLLEQTRKFAASPAGRKTSIIMGREENMVPYPATWFNASSYLEDPRDWGYRAPRPSPDPTTTTSASDELLAHFERAHIQREAQYNASRGIQAERDPPLTESEKRA